MRRHTIVLLLLAVSLGACVHTKIPAPCEPVYIPVYQAPPELPLPPQPDWQTRTADPADWQAYLRAMATDLLEAWAYIATLQHTIEAYNAARTAPPK